MALTLDSVGYRYAGAREPSILDVTLEVRPGSVLGVTGRSEAGKTTLCLVAAGLAPRAIGGMLRGRIAIDGEDTDSWPMHRMTQHVGIGFQSPTTQLSQVVETVFEEVAFGPMNLGFRRDEVVEGTWRALDALGIADLGGRDPRRLSGGQQQLVALAGLVAMRPAHLVLDEPTAQLDPEGTRLVTRALAQLAESGTAILIAEQKADVLGALAAHVLVMDRGTVAIAGRADDVLADERLEELGVLPPASVRLHRLAVAAGVDAGVIEGALSHA